MLSEYQKHSALPQAQARWPGLHQHMLYHGLCTTIRAFTIIELVRLIDCCVSLNQLQVDRVSSSRYSRLRAGLNRPLYILLLESVDLRRESWLDRC